MAEQWLERICHGPRMTFRDHITFADLSCVLFANNKSWLAKQAIVYRKNTPGQMALCW